MSRTIVWWSSVGPSGIVCKLMLAENPDAIIARCETSNEDEDNYRFEKDVMKWLNAKVTILKSDKFDSVQDVWIKRKYMSGIAGAPCTVEMKVAPRLAFQLPTDIHVFGYTDDSQDIERFERLKTNYPELNVRAPLIENRINKASALAMIERAGLKLPRSYAMGFPNANCLQTGCVKATSASYWALLREKFPDRFEKTAKLSREIGTKLARVDGERVFIDEIHKDHKTTKPIVPYCDFLCVLAEGSK